jgi:hypothetical protein
MRSGSAFELGCMRSQSTCNFIVATALSTASDRHHDAVHSNSTFLAVMLTRADINVDAVRPVKYDNQNPRCLILSHAKEALIASAF